jgi:lysophospholipase L1-like esterase
MSVRRKWAYRLIAVAGGTCLAAVVCEGILRLVPGLLPAGTYQMLQADPRNYGVAHPYIGHLQTPDKSFVIASGTDFNTVHHTGPHGFRNSSPWPDRVDIAVLGDSLTFGYGVTESETWPALLARSLGTSRLVNLGLIGAGPQQYLRVYETFGTALQPKLVIVGFFAGNDFSNAETFDRWLSSGVGGNYMVWRDFGQPRRVKFSLRHLASSLQSVVAVDVYPLLRRSYLVNLLRAARGAARRSLSAQPTTFRFPDGREIQLSLDDLATVAAEARPGQREFQLTLDALEQIHMTAARTGAHTLIVLQPSKEEIYLPLMNVEIPDLTRPLREALRSRGIDYLDLAPAFRTRAASGEPLFHKIDGHPTAAGYALIAEAVGAYIREHTAKYPELRSNSRPPF